MKCIVAVWSVGPLTLKKQTKTIVLFDDVRPDSSMGDDVRPDSSMGDI